MTTIFRQLPDIHSQQDLERQGLRAYGRFGLLPDGSLWIGEVRSSHPKELLVGWYWAIDECERLIFSSRNISEESDFLQGEANIIVIHFLKELVKRGVITKKQGVAYESEWHSR